MRMPEIETYENAYYVFGENCDNIQLLHDNNNYILLSSVIRKVLKSDSKTLAMIMDLNK